MVQIVYFITQRIEKKFKNILQDNVNNLVIGNYIIQIVVEGDIQVVENAEKPRVIYKNEEFNLYTIIGRVKRIDLKHFLAPLNLQS